MFVGGGADRGIVFLPEVNDEVLLAFENGDMSSPYVLERAADCKSIGQP